MLVGLSGQAELGHTANSYAILTSSPTTPAAGGTGGGGAGGTGFAGASAAMTAPDASTTGGGGGGGGAGYIRANVAPSGVTASPTIDIR